MSCLFLVLADVLLEEEVAFVLLAPGLKEKEREIRIDQSGMLREMRAHREGGLTVTTTHEQPTTLRALPSLSILHKPDHSPNFLLSST